MRQTIANIIYPEIFLNYDSLKTKHDKIISEFEFARMQFTELEDDNKELSNQIEIYKKQIEELNEKLNKKPIDMIDLFLSSLYKEVPKFAYKNKRRYNNKQFPVFPNEMITPDSFYAVALRKELSPLSNNMRERALVIGQRIDRGIKWVSDEDTTGMPDFYHYIAESIIDGQSDCESHSFAVASIDPEHFGIAFGNANGIWHAWNVFEHAGKLWNLETNSTLNLPNAGNTRVFRHDTQTGYKINWIFTKNKTYEVDRSVHFGSIKRV